MFHVLLRRWWVLVACAVGAAAIALAVTELRPAPYVSSAYVAVPVGAAADIGDRDAQAFAIARAAGRRSGASPGRRAGGWRSAAREDTTEIELRVHGDSADAALQGARAAARLVTEQGTAGAPAGALVVVAAPEEATLDGTGTRRGGGSGGAARTRRRRDRRRLAART